MGARCVCSTLAVAPFPFLVQLLILSLMANAAKPNECTVDQCVHDYQHRLDISSGYRQNCLVLRKYSDCLRGTARFCRGDLNYHSIATLILNWNNEFNCSYVNSSHLDATTVKPTRPPPLKECTYKGRHQDYRSCSLFGDPHLRTFTGDDQTCKVLGTWPLIDNSYLAVQVTNEAVVKGSKASATSMVTIIIKSHQPCSQEKTYEAQTNNLPATFIDGTQSSGVEKSVRIKEREPGRHVEILIKYIATTIILRQVGLYLTFAIRAPREVAFQGGERDGLHLCVKGCPSTERIDYKHVLSHPTSLREHAGGPQHVAMPLEAAVAQCKKHNVTAFYFDSCVFDLMATGDMSFGQAASEAMKDGNAFERERPQPPSDVDRTTASPVTYSRPSQDAGNLPPEISSAVRSTLPTDVRWWLLCLVLLLLLRNR